MEITTELRELVVALAGPRRWSDNRKSLLRDAARNSGISPRTIRSAFYGEPLSKNAAQLLRLAAEKHHRLAAALEGRTQADRERVAALVDVAERSRAVANR